MNRASDGTLEIGTDVGGFRVLRVLGRGGFGVTYEAATELGTRVALKEFLPLGIGLLEGSSEQRAEMSRIRGWALARFRETAIDLHSLSHPNIVKVVHYIPSGTSGFMVMELVQGQTLSTMLKQAGGRMSEAELRPYLEPVMDALAYVHGTGRVHRDVAPDNIMICENGRPVLIDFGAVKAIRRDVAYAEAEAGLTRATAQTYAIFKKFYSAPEQAAAGGVTAASDVYATGAVLYRALCGQPPADSQERKDSLALDGHDTYAPIATMMKGAVRPELADAVDRALTMRRDQRPGDIGTLRDMLGWGAADPVGAVRASGGAGSAPPPLVPPATTVPKPEHGGSRATASAGGGRLGLVVAGALIAASVGGAVWYVAPWRPAEPIVVTGRDASADRAVLDAANEEAVRREAELREARRQEDARQEVVRQEVVRQEAVRQEAVRQEAARQEAARQEAARQEAARREAERQDELRLAEARRREEERRADDVRRIAELVRQEEAGREAARQESARQEAERQEAERQEVARREAARLEEARQDAIRREALRIEEARRREDEERRAEAARRLAEVARQEESARRVEDERRRAEAAGLAEAERRQREVEAARFAEDERQAAAARQAAELARQFEARRLAAEEAERRREEAERQRLEATARIETARRLFLAEQERLRAEQLRRAEAVAACDRLAASPADPNRPAEVVGVALGSIDVGRAGPACRDAVALAPDVARAAFQLGRILEASNDLDGAVSRYRDAAIRGSVAAMNNFGWALVEGRGVARDETAGAEWLRRAADAGLPVAQHTYGFVLEQGRGVPRNAAEAIRYYRLAADAGYGPAMLNLARLLVAPGGAEPRPEEAASRLVAALRQEGATEGDAFRELVTERGGNFAASVRSAVQTQLQREGLYAGRVDGAFGQGTLDALQRARGVAAPAAGQGGWLGAQVLEVTPELARALQLSQAQGAYVSDTTAAGPAARAGIQARDVIVAVEGSPVRNTAELATRIGAITPGQRARFDLIRRGERLAQEVEIGRRAP